MKYISNRKYIVKPEYVDDWIGNADWSPMTAFSEEEIETLAEGWGMDPMDLFQQVDSCTDHEIWDREFCRMGLDEEVIENWKEHHANEAIRMCEDGTYRIVGGVDGGLRDLSLQDVINLINSDYEEQYA